MVFSYNWLQEYNTKKLPIPEKLGDLLSMHSFEVEDVKKVKGDWLLPIDVLPNRAHDCLCHLGVAREIAVLQRGKLKLPKTKRIQIQRGLLPKISVHVQHTELVPRYSAVVVEKVQVDTSPKWLQEKLEKMEVNSINNVVDLTNLVMFEMGQPMHAFDFDQIQGHSMNIRQGRAGEKLETLDDRILALPQGALIIEDNNRLIDLAGIKGGKVSGISKNTHNIVLQAANFAPQQIYRTKAELKYSTQAANIYAHAISSELTIPALERACSLLSELGIQGKVVQFIDLYPRKEKPQRITLDLAYARSLLDIAISPKEAKNILHRLQCKVGEKRGRLEVQPPAYRLDLERAEDIVEEIGRVHGYENIPTILPLAPIVPPAKNPNLVWQEDIRDMLKGLGFTETYTYSFIGAKDVHDFAYTSQEQKGLVELENPISEEFFYLRDSLLQNLLKNVRDNHRQTSSIRLFEIGKVFAKAKNAVQEANMLGIVIWGGTFYEMKGVCDALLQSLGIASAWYDEYQPTPEEGGVELWQEGGSAELKIDGQELGFLGETSEKIRASLKLQKPIAMLEIHVDALIKLATEERSYLAPSRFPASVRDIAVLVPPATKVVELLNVINNAGGKLVQDIDLFDMYADENITGGKKNLAFHIVYQAEDRTLTNKEVDTLHNSIIKIIEQNPEWEVRK